jgi:3-phenylpropionate/cinnamic acid dioxygenase small subunit
MSQELPAPTAITNLLFRYAELIDAGDYKGIGELLKHCTVTSDQGGEWVGAEAVTKMYYDFTRLHGDGTPRSKHVITNPIVELDGDDENLATCRAYYTVFMQTDTLPLQPIVNGRYRDTFEKVDGAWRYKHRVMIVEHVGNVSEHLNMTISGT